MLRLGVIELGRPLAETPPLLAALRERGIDVILRSSEPQSFRMQAERLEASECDGVLLTMDDGAQTEDAAEALLQLSCPILLVGATPELDSGVRDVPAEIHTTVFNLAVACEAIWPDRANPQWVEIWLSHNSRGNRSRGYAAAQRLQGVRLFGAVTGVDDAPEMSSSERARYGFLIRQKWLKQFGVLLSEFDVPAEPRADDIHAFDGDALGALTRRLLEMVSDSSEVVAVSPSLLRRESPAPDSRPFTLVLLSTYGSPRAPHLHRKFSGRVLLAGQAWDGSYALGRYPFGFLRADEDNNARALFAVPGDHVGAVYAALAALDVPTAILRDDFLTNA